MNISIKNKIGEIIRFGLVGILATLINYITFILLFELLGSNISYTIGYFLSIIFNFILSNYFTFKTNPTKNKTIKFAFAHGFNYILQMVLLNVFIHMNISKEIAPIFVYSISIPINFLLVRRALKQI